MKSEAEIRRVYESFARTTSYLKSTGDFESLGMMATAAHALGWVLDVPGIEDSFAEMIAVAEEAGGQQRAAGDN